MHEDGQSFIPEQDVDIHFFPGMMGQDPGIVIFEDAFTALAPRDNITTYGSALLGETLEPEKFPGAAAAIVESIDRGHKAHIIAESFGAVEFSAVLAMMQKRHPDVYRNLNGQNLEVSLISPSGFEEGMSYVRRFGNLLRNQAAVPLISRKNSEYRGVDSINVLFPQTVTVAQLTEALDASLSDLSVRKDGYKDTPFHADTDYAPYIAQDVKDQVGELDEHLAIAIKSGSEGEVREVVKERAETLNADIENVYKVIYYPRQLAAPAPYDLRRSASGLVHLLSDMYNGRVVAPLEDLQRNGVTVNFLQPVLDVMAPFDSIKRYIDQNPDGQHTVVLMDLTTHSSPSLQPGMIPRAIETAHQ